MNAVLATSCQIEYSKEMKTLTIQEQSECTFPDEILPYMSEISHLEINGIFVFSDSSPVLFSLVSLSFGPQGRLLIGDQAHQIQNPVIFSWASNDKCPEQQNHQGSIVINAPEIVSMKLSKTAYFNDNTLILNQTVHNFQVNQKIIVIDPNNPDEMEEFTINQIEGDTITLNEKIITTKFVNPSEQISNSDVLVLFIPEINQEGVFFINSCLSVNVEKINGAIFLNSREIKLKRGSIQNSLFYGSTPQFKKEEQLVSINSSLTKTQFLQIQQIRIEQSFSDNFCKNIFFQIQQLEFILQKISSNNSIIKCKAHIIIPQLRNYKFTSYRFDASNVQVDNKPFSILAFEYSTHFSNLSTFKAKNHLNSLVFADSFISNSFFDFSSIRIIDSIEFDKMVITSNNSDLDMFLLSSSTLLSDKVSIFFSYSIVLGRFNSLLKQAIKNPNHFPLSYDPTNTYFTISLKQSSLIEDQENSVQNNNLFDLQNMKIMKIQPPLSVEYLVQVEDYNFDFIDQRQWSSKLIKEFSYFFKEIPLQYSIQVWLQAHHQISFLPKMMTSNNQFIEGTFDLSRMQIFPGQTHRLYLNFNDTIPDDIDDIRMILKFSLQKKINSNIQNESKRMYVITNRRPVKSFSVIERPADKEFIYEHGINPVFYSETGVTIKLNSELNQVEIQWNEDPINDSHFIINVNYCNQNQFFENGKCVNDCTQLLQGLECISECSKGFYLSSDFDNLNTCYKCQPQCLTCSNESTCDSCFLTSFDSNYCIEMCIAGEYLKERQCLKCQEGCLHCLDDQTCVTCDSTFVDWACKPCDKGFFPRNGECLPCNSNCEECFGESPFQCTICKRGSRRVRNLCILL